MKTEKTSAVFKVGAISLAFMVMGYQTAIFVQKAALARIVADRDAPDTVYVSAGQHFADEERDFGGEASDSPGKDLPGDVPSSRGGTRIVGRREGAHPAYARELRASARLRKVETFRFDPNTISVEDLQRLGFSQKQAVSIDNYRSKGGRFRRKSDFARSYVVADSVFRRLEPYIDIPRLDINKADSAAFDTLPGIGGFFASKMVEMREALGGYSCKEQLMDIWHFDKEKYDGLSDLICCSPPRDSFRLWSLPADSLRLHPFIRTWETARAIVLYRDNVPRSGWNVGGLLKAGVLTEEQADRLSRCILAAPR